MMGLPLVLVLMMLLALVVEIELQQAWELGEQEEQAAQSTAGSETAKHLLKPSLAEQRQ